MEARKVSAGNGWEWIVSGFDLFRKNPGIWIVIMLIYFAIMLVLAIFSMIPLLGMLANIAITLIAPVFLGGLMLGCRALENGEELKIEHLFAGFQTKAGQLIAVGAIYLAVMMAITIVFVIIAVMTIGMGAAMASATDPTAAAASTLVTLLFVLVGFALMIPVMMAYIYAPLLVVLNDMNPIDAMKASFIACLRNILPWLVYGIVTFVLAFIATLPLLLGWLVLWPVLNAALYASYKDVFNIENTDQAV
ncbi:MAG: hypothetical protein LBV44_02665 [Methylobacillus sp.]|jgi:uncharacterized membrane protein|nr:hypothetical protein [Methylobacillus sp.]